MAIPVQAPRRLAVVVSHPTQYYSPWFRWLTAHTDLQVRVFYLWDFGVSTTHDRGFGQSFKWDVDLLSGYDSEFVPNRSRSPGPERFWGFNNPELPARLESWRPEAVLIFGYKYATHLRTIAWARRRRVPLIFRGDSHLLGRPQPRGLRHRVLCSLYRKFAAITYVGQANRAYFHAFQVPDERLFFAPHCVDDALFDPTKPEIAAKATALRSELGLSAATRVVLFAGKLIPAKQPRELLDAFISLRRPNTALVFVGDGPEKPALLELARAAGAPPLTPLLPHSLASSGDGASRIHFLPFANQSEMPSHYTAADVFVLPSRGLYETWGLAVNEAMHMDLPCLVSDRVGCQQDLVTPGETGWVFRAADARDFRDQLTAALTDDLAPMKAKVRERISGYTYAAASAGLLRALATCRT